PPSTTYRYLHPFPTRRSSDLSGPSLETRSSFQPRFRMSARHPISFSHSWDVVRKTRKSATASQCGGYGLESGEDGGGGISRVLLDRKSTRLNSSHVAISYAVF